MGRGERVRLRARMARALAASACAAALIAESGARAGPADDGQWTSTRRFPSATHAHLVPSGLVFFFGEYQSGFAPHFWDPATGHLKRLGRPGFNIFCSGHSLLEDGRVLITGGHQAAHVGFAHATVFDPFSGAFRNVPDMNAGRWYPTNTTLADGEVLVVAGEVALSGDNNPLPQVYQPSTNTWRNLTGALLGVPYYPRMLVAPNGKVFMAGTDPITRYLDTSGKGKWTFVANTSSGRERTYGPAVTYEPGKVLLVGGGDPPTASVEIIDLNQAKPKWKTVAPMSVPRRQHNATLLPDGRVLVTGGSRGAGFNDRTSPVLQVEVWDPATNGWTTWAAAPSFRGYHSTALLLPDGRVLSAGGRGEEDFSMEVFSPPYLFKGPRPTIAAAPGAIAPGDGFVVETPDAGDVAQVTVVRHGSVTHAFDQNQRFLRLEFTRSGSSLQISAPANNNLAPPGHYMLFLIGSAGVPSMGWTVELTRSGPATKVIALRDEWRYDDDGIDLGSAWLDGAFDDSSWRVGPSPLGYGEGDEATALPRPASAPPSVYFRKKVSLPGPVTAAELAVIHDDGAAVWVNGQLVFQKYTDNGLDFSAWASDATDNERSRASIALDPNPFVVGENVVAVMVKQENPVAADLSFAMELSVEMGPPPPSRPPPDPDTDPGRIPAVQPPPDPAVGPPVTRAPDRPAARAGCGCSPAGGAGAVLLGGIPLALWRRRRAS